MMSHPQTRQSIVFLASLGLGSEYAIFIAVCTTKTANICTSYISLKTRVSGLQFCRWQSVSI